MVHHYVMQLSQLEHDTKIKKVMKSRDHKIEFTTLNVCLQHGTLRS